ncbi:MAG: hypothetical protein LN408_02780 [Candidatus Thermoplasmatota archaeon]|jgi:hypothetical protein|nr:hypothetical protein [Candidatus Thermoplasmatota archaeon]MCK5300468.1 hypothetical protein [Thermoplasmatales archaeon]
MKINLSDDIRNIFMLFIMILLPLILIGVGVLTGFINAGYYILIIFWFGMGLIFYGALN